MWELFSSPIVGINVGAQRQESRIVEDGTMIFYFYFLYFF
jgi:hypothetical protein